MDAHSTQRWVLSQDNCTDANSFVVACLVLWVASFFLFALPAQRLCSRARAAARDRGTWVRGTSFAWRWWKWRRPPAPKVVAPDSSTSGSGYDSPVVPAANSGSAGTAQRGSGTRRIDDKPSNAKPRRRQRASSRERIAAGAGAPSSPGLTVANSNGTVLPLERSSRSSDIAEEFVAEGLLLAVETASSLDELARDIDPPLAHEDCACCTTAVCTNVDPRLFGLRKQQVEAHTSTIFCVVALYGLLVCDSARWQGYVSFFGVGVASTAHHAWPRQHSAMHWWDNTQLVWAAMSYTLTGPAWVYWAASTVVYLVALRVSVRVIKVGSVAFIAADFIYMMLTLPTHISALALMWGIATAVCYATVDYHWSIHSVWHFTIACWGAVGAIGLTAADATGATPGAGALAHIPALYGYALA